MLYNKEYDMKFKKILFLNSHKTFNTRVRDIFQWMFIDITSNSDIKHIKYMGTHQGLKYYKFIYPENIILNLLNINEVEDGFYFKLINKMKKENDCEI
jgi:hypothetical protein